MSVAVFKEAVPNYPGGPVTESDDMKNNFKSLYFKSLMDGDFTGLQGYYSVVSSAGLVTTVKDSGNVTRAVGTVTVVAGSITQIVWAFTPPSGGTYTYTYAFTYPGGLPQIVLTES